MFSCDLCLDVRGHPKIRSLGVRGKWIPSAPDTPHRVGIVGNDYPDFRGIYRQRWTFRGDLEPLLDKRFAVHRALWATLSLS